MPVAGSNVICRSMPTPYVCRCPEGLGVPEPPFPVGDLLGVGDVDADLDGLADGLADGDPLLVGRIVDGFGDADGEPDESPPPGLDVDAEADGCPPDPSPDPSLPPDPSPPTPMLTETPTPTPAAGRPPDDDGAPSASPACKVSAKPIGKATITATFRVPSDRIAEPNDRKGGCARSDRSVRGMSTRSPLR